MSKNNRTLKLSAEDIDRYNKVKPVSMSNNIDKGKGCIALADVMQMLPLIPNEFADLIIVDPPYNLTKTFGDSKFLSRNREDYREYLRSWFYPLVKKLKPNGTLYMCGDWKCSSDMQMVIEEKLTIINRITWQREKGRGAKSNWKNSMEDIWFAVKNPDDYYFNADAVKLRRKVLASYKENDVPKDWEETEDGKFRDTCPSNFWDDITVPFWSMPENTDHPTQKPEKLCAKLILASSKEGDVIFDPFMGSGTVPVTAKKLGRKYYGIEIDETYWMYAMKRLENAEHDKTIQGYDNGIFWERNAGK